MASYKSAVDAKCKDCIYDPQSGLGTWREQVTRCSVYRCPLWEFRPTATGGKMADAPGSKLGHHAWLLEIEAAETRLVEG